MQSSSTFTGLSGPIREAKKSILINNYENTAYSEVSQAKQVVGK